MSAPNAYPLMLKQVVHTVANVTGIKHQAKFCNMRVKMF